MRTLKLHLDDLQVTSFDTTTHAGARGTVVAHDATDPAAAAPCGPS